MKTLTNSITCGILLAAGTSERMGTNKLLMPICSTTPLKLSFDVLVASNIDKIIITVSELTSEFAHNLAKTTGKQTICVDGGSSRSQSVYAALSGCGYDTDVVVIHDSARCLVTKDIINDSIELAKKEGSAIASCPVVDTLRNRSTNEVVDRDCVLAMQTPQTFSFRRIKWAYDNAAQYVGLDHTDDCSMYIHAGFQPVYFQTRSINAKLTHPQDVELFEAILRARQIRAEEV